MRATPFLSRKSPSVSRKTYATYGAALEDSRGYEDAGLLDVVEAKTCAVRDEAPDADEVASEGDVHRLLAISIAAAATRKSLLNILDFGGACGAHYYRMRRLAPTAPQLRWVIVETRGMAHRANRVARDYSSVCAVESVEDAVGTFGGDVDVVHAAGALQYVHDPYAMLAALLGVRAPVLLLTRGALTRGTSEIIVVQESSLSANGPGLLPPQFQDGTVSYPFVFARRERVMAQLRAAYKRVVLLSDAAGYFPVNDEPVCAFAALCTDPH
jgi:putative methyltransferase (TIGR04325 family)